MAKFSRKIRTGKIKVNHSLRKISFYPGEKMQFRQKIKGRKNEKGSANTPENRVADDKSAI